MVARGRELRERQGGGGPRDHGEADEAEAPHLVLSPPWREYCCCLSGRVVGVYGAGAIVFWFWGERRVRGSARTLVDSTATLTSSGEHNLDLKGLTVLFFPLPLAAYSCMV